MGHAEVQAPRRFMHTLLIMPSVLGGKKSCEIAVHSAWCVVGVQNAWLAAPEHHQDGLPPETRTQKF